MEANNNAVVATNIEIEATDIAGEQITFILKQLIFEDNQTNMAF